MRGLAVLSMSLVLGLTAGALTAQGSVACGDKDVSLDALVQAGCSLSAEQIAAAMDNPVGELISLPVAYERKTVTEPFFGTSHVIENIRVTPTFPVNLGLDWSLVNRVSFNFPRVPINAEGLPGMQFDAGDLDLSFGGTVPTLADFARSTAGFGDLAYVGLFTPRDTVKVASGKLIWRIGPTIILPTATNELLGQGKYQAGIAGVAAYLGEVWTLGLFPQHWWSIAGDGRRPEVSRSSIQYFISRKLPDQWSIGMTPTVAINWNARGGLQVDLPVGIGLNKTVFLGQLPVRFGIEYQHYLTSPDGLHPQSAIKLSISSAVPAALLRGRQ